MECEKVTSPFLAILSEEVYNILGKCPNGKYKCHFGPCIDKEAVCDDVEVWILFSPKIIYRISFIKPMGIIF